MKNEVLKRSLKQNKIRFIIDTHRSLDIILPPKHTREAIFALNAGGLLWGGLSLLLCVQSMTRYFKRLMKLGL